MNITLAEIAQDLGCELRGDPDCLVSGVATLQHAATGQITFLANKRYRRFLTATQASAVILAEADAEACPVNVLISSNPYLSYARLAAKFAPQQAIAPGIHASAVVEEGSEIAATSTIGANCYIGEKVHIADNVVIGPGCVIEHDVSLGAGTRLVANVSLCHGVMLGRNCLLHPGVVIGGDGFGIASDQGRWVKVPQLGRVVIGDDVEIGVNTTIDRGALEDTVIEDGVKLDNLIQIAHNVHIGADTAIAGCTGIAGSTVIGKRCQIGGAASIVGHLTIVDDVHITAMSFVTGNINMPGLYSSGVPLEPNKIWQKNAARFGQLDNIARRLKMLEKKSDT